MEQSADGRCRYAAELESQFMADATEVEATDGRAWRGNVPLASFVEELASEDDFDSWGAIELFEREAGVELETLIHLAVRNPGPPDWDWSLTSFTIGDRGYIMMIHEDPSDGPMLPIFAAWEPVGSDPAFEAAFVAGYVANLQDFIGIGTHYSLAGRLTPELWQQAFSRAVEAAGAWSWVGDSGDYPGSIDDEDGRQAALDHYIATRQRDQL